MLKPVKSLDRVPLSDVPTARDVLGYENLVEPIASRILAADRSNTPLTIGINGQWGVGKTSFLLILAERLRREGLIPILV
jgi:hypothetical protein